MTTQQMTEFRQCAQSAIEHGIARIIASPLTDKQIRRITDATKIEHQRQRREQWLKDGLTSKGQPRRRLRENLDGWTDEQKRKRLSDQKKAWRERQIHEH